MRAASAASFLVLTRTRYTPHRSRNQVVGRQEPCQGVLRQFIRVRIDRMQGPPFPGNNIHRKLDIDAPGLVHPGR